MIRLLAPLFLALAALSVPSTAAALSPRLPALPNCDTDPDVCAALLREVMVSRYQLFPGGMSGEEISIGVTVGGSELPWGECLTPTPEGYAVVLCLPTSAINGAILLPDALRSSGIAQPRLQPQILVPALPDQLEERHREDQMHERGAIDHHDDMHAARHHGTNVGALLVGALIAGAAFAAGVYFGERRTGRTK